MVHPANGQIPTHLTGALEWNSAPTRISGLLGDFEIRNFPGFHFNYLSLSLYIQPGGEITECFAVITNSKAKSAISIDASSIDDMLLALEDAKKTSSVVNVEGDFEGAEYFRMQYPPRHFIMERLITGGKEIEF